MQRHDVTGGHEVVDAIDERDLGIRSERVGVHMRVPNLDSHAKTVGDARHMLPDATESHKTKRFAGELGAEHTMPTALAHLRVELSYMARQLHHERDGELGDRGVPISTHIAYAHAILPRTGEVDVAGHPGTAECEALRMSLRMREPCIQIVVDVHADHNHGVGTLATPHDLVRVQSGVSVHSQARHIA